MASTLDFYHQPVTRQMVGNWATGLEQIDGEIVNLRTLMGLTRYLIAILPQGNAIISNAEKRVQNLGQIPVDVLNRLDRLDWINGTPDRIAHLQIIWRCYLAFEQRQALAALRGELAKQAKFSGSRYTNLISNMRGIQRTIYHELEKQGLNPYQLDPMLDQDVDLIEWLLELRLWHYLSSQYDQNGLAREGLYQWWLAEKSAADRMTSEPSQPIGHPQTAFTDMFTLHRGIHDANVKAMVTMGLFAADNNLSMDALTQFLVKVLEARREGLDQSTFEKMLAAFELSFQDVDPHKIDAAALAAASIVERQMTQQTKPQLNERAVGERGIEPSIKFDGTDIHFEQGNVFLQKGQIDEAIREFQIAVNLNSNDAEAHGNLGFAYAQAGRWNEAIRESQTALRINPQLAEAHINLGTAYSQQGNLQAAINEFRAALQVNPNLPAAHFDLATIYVQQQKWNEASQEAQAALRLDPNLAAAHNILGEVHRSQGHPDEAIREYQEALRIDPSLAEAHCNLAMTYGIKERWNDAAREFQTAVRLNPNLAHPHHGLGLIYRQQSRIDDAIREFEILLRLTPNDTEARGTLGTLYGQKGRANDAAREFQAILRVNPNDADAHFAMAAVYLQQKCFDDAITEVKTAARLGNKNAYAMLQKIQGLERR